MERGKIEESSIVRAKCSNFERVDFVSTRIISVLSPFNLKNVEVDQDLTSDRHVMRDDEGRDWFTR